MAIGQMKNRIQIFERATTKSALGEREETYNEIARMWAERKRNTASEQSIAAGIEAPSVRQYRIRYRNGITTNHLVSDGGQIFEITEIDQQTPHRRSDLLITCRRFES